jgi:N-hydroxyarylamine O-acetyltransferase
VYIDQIDKLKYNFDLQSYLERIGYNNELGVTLEILSELQKSHLKNIPFENLDIHYHVPINFKNAFEKIIHQHRGGFCYELNYAFYQLLKSIGFGARLISCGVFDKKKEKYGEEFDHMAIIVEINGVEYLADVGFGEFAFHPLKIEIDKEQTDPRGIFAIRRSNDDYLIVEKKDINGTFIPEYKFTTTERQPDEYKSMCQFHQTSAESHFTQQRICSLATNEGRITLTGNLLKITNNGITTETEVSSEAEFESLLSNHFGITLHAKNNL